MRPKRLLASRALRRVHRRAIALILLALLTMVSVPVSAERVAGMKEPATQLLSQISQANNGLQLAIQGKKLYEAGQLDAAARIWQQAASAYAQAGDKDGMTESLINIAEALQALGLYPRACNTLLQAFKIADPDCQKLTKENENRQQRRDSLLTILEAQPNSLNKAIGLRSLGDVLQKLDALELSTKVLQLSVNVARTLPSPQDESAALLSLGNTERARGDRARVQQDTASEQKARPWRCLYRPSTGAAEKYQQAASLYQQAATESAAPITWVQAQLNRLSVLLETDALSDAQDLWPQIKSKLRDLPSSRAAVYAQINLAESLTCLKQASAVDAPSWREIAQPLATAVQQARSLGDQRAESYALGYLGGVYAQTQKQPGAQDLTYAQNLTQQALVLAQAIQASDIAYQWQWQLGYLLRTQEDITGAIAAYEAAVESLKSVRQDLAAINPDVQFSFRDSVDPVYRQFVELLLPSEGTEPNQENLQKARQMIASLQVAELENFLDCTLQNALPVPLDQVADQHNAAIIYPIILRERLAVIVKLPGRAKLLYYETPIEQLDLESKLEKLRIELEKPYTTSDGKRWSQEVYDWLIRPAETYSETPLDPAKVKTLVFVLDGRLRNIPMAALRDRDRQQYLVEKYAVALNLGLQLQNPQPIRQKRLEALTAGITKQLRGVEQLKYVGLELELINKVVPTRELLDEKFSITALQSQINSRRFSMVHFATHAQFSSQPDKTSIQAWDAPINVNKLSDIFRTQSQTRPDPIEILVLSACQTATGDERAVLGLAGVAVRSGARSTIASVWYLNDQSSALLMNWFYRYLKDPSVPNKAEALRRAQQELMKDPNYDYAAPAYWAPYVLVGNWL